MPAELLFQFTGFAVRTAILFGLLWLMLRLEKLNQRFAYRLLKLVGAAALAGALDLVPYAGHFLAVPVLLVSVKKVTRVDYLEALIAVIISYTLVFGANHFLLGSLLDRLRTRVENSNAFEVILRPRFLKPAGQPGVISTNPQVFQTNPPAPGTATNQAKPDLAKPAPGTPLSTNLPVPTTNRSVSSAPTNLAAPPVVKPAEVTSKYFTIKGVTRNGANSAVTIQSGTKIYSIFLGEAALMQTVDGPISVRFADLGEDSVTLEINGEPAKFPIRRP